MTESTTPLMCPVCGTPPVPGARFCFACGAALDVAGLSETYAERRVVTVLFGDLSDFTAWAEDVDPERVSAVTDRVLAALSRATTDMGGRVDKLTGDGIMAVFGAPTAHEDDAERAVRAAERMQRDVRQLMEEEGGGGRRLGFRVGINTGEVLAGVQAHLAYTVVGDTVNTASRLSDAAGVGAVYAGRDTALATMAIASWRALPPLRLKGKREPVAAYELVGLRPPGAARLGLGDEAPLIGRDAEFGRLVGKLLDVVHAQRSASVVVTGEAGVGKTRLVYELDRFASELPSVRLLWGRCPPYGEGRELAPLAEWMRVVFGISDADDAIAAEGKVRRAIQRIDASADRVISAATTDRLLGLLGLVERAPLGPRDMATPGTPGSSRDPFVDAVAAVLATLAADGPLVLVIDDAQWAPPPLLAAVTRIARTLGGPLLVIAIGRSDVLGQDWWEQLPDLEVLPVAPLDDPASERLLRAYLGGADLDPSVREVLLARAQGNPFFLAELLHLLVDRGLLRRVADGWRLSGDLPRDVLPAGVQAVLAARIDSLDQTTKAVLRDAAIAGNRFTIGMLQALEPETSAENIERAISELQARGIVRSGDTARSYVFAHSLAQDVTYAGLPKVERARRHARLAQWAATSVRASAGDIDALVATQSEQAVRLATEMRLGPDDSAWTARGPGVEALIRLGQAALSRDDNTRAAAVLGRALELADGRVEQHVREDALIGRAAAYVGLHRLDDALADLDQPQSSTDPRRRAAALVVLGDVLRRRGEVKRATEVLVSALATASDAGIDRVTGEALRQLGMIDYRAGRLSAAEEHFRQSLALAERVGDRRGAGWAFQHLAWSSTTRGDYEKAEQMLRQAAEVFAALDDDGGLSWCAGTEAFVRLLQGRHRQARNLAATLLPVGRAVGDRWGVAACLTIDGFAAAELGDLAMALNESMTAYDDFTALGDTWGQSMALIARAAGLRGAGRIDEAIDVLHRAIETAETAGQPLTQALGNSMLGYCLLDVGDVDAAQTAVDGAIASVRPLDLRPAALIGLRVLSAQVLRAKGQLDEALGILREAGLSGDEPSLLFPRRQALAHLAGALLDAGQADEALATIQRAFQVPADDVRSRTVALRVLAHCLAAAGDRPAAEHAARQAIALAGATEMTSELEASERVLKSLR